jgi:hypothetical protein
MANLFHFSTSFPCPRYSETATDRRATDLVVQCCGSRRSLPRRVRSINTSVIVCLGPSSVCREVGQGVVSGELAAAAAAVVLHQRFLPVRTPMRGNCAHPTRLAVRKPFLGNQWRASLSWPISLSTVARSFDGSGLVMGAAGSRRGVVPHRDRSDHAATAKRPLIEPHRRSSARPRRECLLQAQGAWREVAAASPPSSSLHVQISPCDTKRLFRATPNL